ncbi:MAG: ComF family protein [Patescibacteria group bacterium]
MALPGSKLLTWCLNAVFPRFCVNCQTEGALLCQTCLAAWEHEPPAPASDHISLFAYANPLVRQLICTWKYTYDQSAFELLKAEASLQLAPFKSQLSALGVEAIMPLPLSPKRLRERGFNQSRLLADWLAGELNLPVCEGLERTHRAGHQADLGYDERRLAMAQSPFRLKAGTPVPAKILLVDDVWTTGATLGAAKGILEQQAGTQVFALTLAEG